MNGEEIKTWYMGNESFMNKFGGAGCNCSSYEECRADLVAIYFSTKKEAWELLLGDKAENWEELMKLSWISAIKAGFAELKNYSIDSKKWK